MIKTKMSQVINNKSLDGYSITVKTNEDNEEWITINHFETNIHLPVDTIAELVEALQKHYNVIRKYH
jgi:hypothetical protein